MDFLKDKWINGKFYAWNETEYLEFDPELWEITPVSEKDILKINSCGLKRYYKNSEELNNKDWIILVFNIINECNLNCIYCYSKGSKFDPISDKAITTIAESYLKK